MSASEVARITNQIETESRALKQAFTGFSIVARHLFIQHKYASIGNYRRELGEIIGEERAKEIVGSIYVEVMEDE